jgi:hypothetical protein
VRSYKEVYDASLKCWWGRDFGTLCVLDPFSGEVYEFDYAAEKARIPRWWVWRAMDEKSRAKMAAGQNGQQALAGHGGPAR